MNFNTASLVNGWVGGIPFLYFFMQQHWCMWYVSVNYTKYWLQWATLLELQAQGDLKNHFVYTKAKLNGIKVFFFVFVFVFFQSLRVCYFNHTPNNKQSIFASYTIYDSCHLLDQTQTVWKWKYECEWHRLWFPCNHTGEISKMISCHIMHMISHQKPSTSILEAWPIIS